MFSELLATFSLLELPNILEYNDLPQPLWQLQNFDAAKGTTQIQIPVDAQPEWK